MAEVLTQATTNYADLFGRLNTGSEAAWLLARREEGLRHFNALGFPTPKHEDWRFTSLTPITEAAFALAPSNTRVEPEQITPFAYDGLPGGWMVFVDGHYRAEYSKMPALPNGMIVTSLKDALRNHGDLVEKHYGRQTEPDKHTFTALNEAFAQDGLFVYVPKNTAFEEPIHVVFLASDHSEGTMANVRNLLVLEQSSQITILETHGATGDQNYFKNIVTELYAGENAYLDHYVIQRESLNASQVSTLHVHEERSSVARSHTIDLGGNLVRHNIWAMLDGEGCDAILNGLYVLRGKQHVDNFMWVEHRKENIPSHELYKGVLDDESSAVFTGRIYVHQEAQKTDAKQTNQTLLLSENAKINTKPQLEIYADDVKCTHGATIGQLDSSAQFYCESRGIDSETARRLLVHAFASDIVERIRLESVRHRVEELLIERLEQ